MDPTTLAQEVVNFLTPYLPYLVKAIKIAGKKGAEKAGELAVDAGSTKAQTLWSKLKKKDKESRLTKAGKDVVEGKENGDVNLRKLVEETLRSDPKLLMDLQGIYQTRVEQKTILEHVGPDVTITGPEIGEIGKGASVEILSTTKAKKIIASKIKGPKIDKIE